MAYVRAAIRRASFVKPDAGNKAVNFGTEFQSEFHGSPVLFKYRIVRYVIRRREDR
jgi:hypothetical protein